MIEVSKPLKIAICVTGQIRNYEYTKYDLANLVSLFNKRGHAVDLFGHTWDYCQLPNLDPNNFKEVFISSQQMLINWIKNDFEGRITRYGFENEHDDFCKNPLNFEKILSKAVASYTQQWEFQNLLFKFPHESYDIIIRWRWDNSFITVSKNKTNDNLIENLKQYAIDLIERFAYANDRYSSELKLDILASHGILNKSWQAIDDMWIVFMPSSIKELKKINFLNFLTKLHESRPTWNDKFYTSPLWKEWLTHNSLTIGCVLPFIVHSSASTYGDINE